MKKYTKKVVSYIYAYPFDGDYSKIFSGISVSETDRDEVTGNGPYGMIAVNPKDQDDRWYVNHQYFQDNYQEMPEQK